MGNLTIVAIPAEDDYVNKISSEKIAHMTLLVLGETAQVKNLDSILGFVEHAAKQSLCCFDMTVDRRGDLGPNLADVLFFAKSKWSGFTNINSFRSNLLKDDNIRAAYDSMEQFPEWVPHLTLGYPETPANEDNRDYPGFYSVRFDRIAVWVDDFQGLEFPLDAEDWVMDVAWGDIQVDESVVEYILTHHGTKGMKWGQRKSGNSVPSGQSRTRAEKKIDKADQRLVNTLSSPRKSAALKAQLHNDIIPVVNSKVNVINAKPKYFKAAHEGRLKNPDDLITKQYIDEMNKAYMTTMNEHLKGFSNASGTKVVTASINQKDFLGFTLTLSDRPGVKHEDPLSMNIHYIRADDSSIIGFTFVDEAIAQSVINEVLAHFGTKGMKWGVRKDSPSGPQGVVVSQKRKKIKTKGGQGHPAHSDAVRARTSGQIAKKSGIGSLSNAELKAFNERMNLEQNAKRLSFQDKSPGKKFVLTLVGKNAGKGVESGLKAGLNSPAVKRRVAKGAAALAFA